MDNGDVVRRSEGLLW